MMFFGKHKVSEAATGEAQPKRRSIFGLLFNPDIGASIRPLAESTSVFINLIAMIFAMNGLFPKDHPALLGVTGARLSLSEIISTAWSDLSFTVPGLPKVLLFFAVVGALVTATLSVITALIVGFMGTAHAATPAPTLFAPVGSNDLGQNALDYIFQAIPVSSYYAQNGQPIAQTVNIQCAFQSALGFYSNAMLVFAGIILLYHLASMIVQTAHEGTVMGKKASQVWAPIRLVVAVGLLVPVGTASACHTTGGGLNAGQYIVIQMASWGSGMASQAWKSFITTLTGMQYNYIQPNTPYVNDVVADITSMEACRFAWNYEICATDDSAVGGNPSTDCLDPNNYNPTGPGVAHNIPAPVPQKDYPSPGDTYYNYTPSIMSQAGPTGVCGSFTIPAAVSGTSPASAAPTVGSTMAQTVNATPGAIAADISQAHQITVSALLSSFTAMGGNVAKFISPLWDGPIPTNSDFITLSNLYQTNLKNALDGTLKGVITPQLNGDAISSLGWVSAGAWLNTIARDQGSIVNAYQDGLPKTNPPDMGRLLNDGDVGKEVAPLLNDFNVWIHNGNVTASPPTAPSADAIKAALAATCSAQAAAAAGGVAPPDPDPVKTADAIKKILMDLGLPTDKIKVGNQTTNLIFKYIDLIAGASGVWTQDSGCPNDYNHFNLGSQLVTANPLAEIAFWGHANLKTAYSLFDGIVAVSFEQMTTNVDFETERNIPWLFFSARDKGQKAAVLGIVSSVLGMVSLIFFICGFTIAFVLPLLPFFRFFFNVLGWIVAVLEAVVAVPLIALGHLNPEGEGLPGPSAKVAYFMVFNVFLRPVLSVFGLIAGLIVFYVAVMFLNATYAIAVAGTSALYHSGYGTLVRLIYTLTYGATVYVCANNCFKPIGSFPEHALRWIGQHAHHEKIGDGGRAVQGIMGQTSGYLGDKAVSAVRLKPPG